MSLTKEAWKTGRKLRISEPIELPDRSEPVFARELNGNERRELDKRRFAPDAKGNLVLDFAGDDANWACACACDQDGKLLFTWDELADVQVLPAPELAAVAREAMKLNRIGSAAVEAAAKNS